jgi:hypothetical protein
MKKYFNNGRHLNGVCMRSGRLFLLICLSLAGFTIASQAQRSLNVTTYGAVGDAVRFWVNSTSNSVVVRTTNHLSSLDIGKAIEVFGCGPQTFGINSYGGTNGNQDIVATITNVFNATNIYISQICQKTLTNAFATYGHNNQTNFQAAIAAVGTDTNDIINIPSGTYLLLPTTHAGVYSQSAIALQRGGINFVGAGTNSTTLLSQGAWTLMGRGILVEIASPATNNLPLTFSRLTMDGGVQQGNTSNHGFPASNIDGTGWDTSHDALLTWCVSSASLPHIYFTNVLVTHWRGEEFKSIDQPVNSTIGIYNCTFADGNATALNVYESWDVRSNLFVNLFQVAEYYQQYYSFPSYFEYNVITNITGNGFAINGGKGSNPPFYMESNVFYLSGGNGIETEPADNLYFIGNIITNTGNYVVDFDLSASGAQGTYCNSNIVISGNLVVNSDIFIELGGGSGPTDIASVANTTINNNVVMTNSSQSSVNFIVSYGGFTTNINIYSNDLSLNTSVSVTTGQINDPYPYISTNNNYWTPIVLNNIGSPQPIHYTGGSKYKFVQTYNPASQLFWLDDTNAAQMPNQFGTVSMVFTNATSQPNAPILIYPSSNINIAPVILPYAQTVTFFWNGSAWMTNNPLALLPPVNLHFQ